MAFKSVVFVYKDVICTLKREKNAVSNIILKPFTGSTNGN